MELPQLASFKIGGNTITIPTNRILTEREVQQIRNAANKPFSWSMREIATNDETPQYWVRNDENKRYLSYQAIRNIKEAQMRKSSDFTDTESEALDEFFAEMSVVKERSDAD